MGLSTADWFAQKSISSGAKRDIGQKARAKAIVEEKKLMLTNAVFRVMYNC